MLLAGLFFTYTETAEAAVVENPDDILVLVNKTYQLPADYVPELTTPDVAFSGNEEQLRPVAAEALENMFAEASEEGIALRAASGYRSYEYQQEVHQDFVEQYGEEYANQVSAKAGHSEHQTGLAIDVTSPAVNNRLIQEFANTEAGEWVASHADEYGFIIRYPEGKEAITGYNYEPWHLRYVGGETASYISENNLTLETYLNENNDTETQTYTVQAGDTFWEIAQNYPEVSVQELMNLNPGIDPYALQIGTILTISGNGAETPDSGDNDSTNSEETYIVKAGDTFWEIAQNYETVTVTELMNANPGIAADALQIGEELTVPVNGGSDGDDSDAPSDTETYTIKAGDTLWEIAAEREGVTLDELLAANPTVEPRLLTVGSVINIP